jgi:transcriptional regulator with XRE-family HTH domain
MNQADTQFERGTLYLKTIELLKHRPITLSLERIEKDTGLPKGWLASILRRSDLSPSVDRIQRLYEYLAGKPLNIN